MINTRTGRRSETGLDHITEATRFSREEFDHPAVRGAKRETMPARPKRTGDQEKGQDLTRLVVKYFEEEIREAIAEITASVYSNKISKKKPALHRKQV